MKKEIVKIDKIKVMEGTYPRNKVSWFAVYKYKQAMKTGAEFPPIDVSKNNGNYFLIDGKHRIEAMKQLKGEIIDAIIHENLSKEEIIKMAIKANTEHGQALSTQEVVKSILKLQKMNVNTEDISKIVNIPKEKIQPLVTKKTAWKKDTLEQIILKKPQEHLSGTEIEENKETETLGYNLTQVHLLNDLIGLLKLNQMNLEKTEVRTKLTQIKNLIEALDL